MKIDFEYSTPYGIFRDSIVIEKTFTAEQIESLKQQRLKSWIDFIENPPPVPINEEEYQEVEDGE
jgi:hypothetical protein